VANKALSARPRLIAHAAAEYEATLLSLDHRAGTTYKTVGAAVEQLVG